MSCKAANFTIIIDTREQRPWAFGEGVPIIRTSLPAGDYSIVGLEGVVSIERKSLDDLVNTLFHSEDRFFKELVKLKGYRRKLVAVEGSVEDILEHRYTSETTPLAVLGKVNSLHAIFNIPFVWWGSRQYAEYMALKWLEMVWKRSRKWEEREIANAQ